MDKCKPLVLGGKTGRVDPRGAPLEVKQERLNVGGYVSGPTWQVDGPKFGRGHSAIAGAGDAGTGLQYMPVGAPLFIVSPTVESQESIGRPWLSILHLLVMTKCVKELRAKAEAKSMDQSQARILVGTF